VNSRNTVTIFQNMPWSCGVPNEHINPQRAGVHCTGHCARWGVPQAWPLEGGAREGQAGPSPDGLVLQPAGVTLLVACLVGCLQLLWCGHDCPGVQAGLPSLLEGQ
jgi:hypothetical protein